jgi:hypothetical protein
MNELLSNLKIREFYPVAGLALLGTAGLVWGLEIGIVTVIILAILGTVVTGVFAYRQFNFKALIFLLGMITIMALGVIGTQGSYNTALGWPKMWGLALAGLIGLAILLQPNENHVYVRDLLLITAVVAAVVILLTYDWVRFPTDFEFLNRIGFTISQVFAVPKSEFRIDDALGGICVTIMPVFYTEFISRVERKQKFLIGLFLLAIFLLLFTVLLTGTRSLWIGIVIGAGAYAIGHFVFHESKKAAAYIVGFTSMLPLLSMVWLANPGGKFSEILSGLDYRFELISNSGWLIPDFWLVGGGAGSYPGLYSRYILNESHFYIAHSHNLLSNLAIETGIISTSVVIFLILVPIIIFLTNIKEINFSRFSAENAAVFSTFIFILLLDDPFWGGGSVPFLFVPLTFLLKDHLGRAKITILRTSAVSVITFIAILLGNYYLFGRNVTIPEYLSNKAYANLELAGFPNEVLGFYDPLEEPDEIINTYKGIYADTKHKSAGYRLGIHFLREGDFTEAFKYLEEGYRLQPKHPGIRENYAFTLVWLDQLEEAKPLGQQTNKFTQKLAAFVTWWKETGKDDLSNQALEMISLMNN